MKKTKNVKAKGILGGILKSRALSTQEMEILKRANTIKLRQSLGGRVNKALQEIRSYVTVSRHSIPQKIENLKADLKNTQDPTVRKALEKAIAELQNF